MKKEYKHQTQHTTHIYKKECKNKDFKNGYAKFFKTENVEFSTEIVAHLKEEFMLIKYNKISPKIHPNNEIILNFKTKLSKLKYCSFNLV